MPTGIIDKGIPTAGLLAHMLFSSYGDHIPPYRQELISARADLAVPRSTLGRRAGMCRVQLQLLVDAQKEKVRKS